MHFCHENSNSHNLLLSDRILYRLSSRETRRKLKEGHLLVSLHHEPERTGSLKIRKVWLLGSDVKGLQVSRHRI